MRITESRLKRFIRKVLLESINDIESFTEPQSLSVYTSHDSFEDFITNPDMTLSISEEEKEKLLILTSMLLSAYFVDGGMSRYFNRGGKDVLQKYPTLTLEFEYVFGVIEESMDDERDRKEQFAYFSSCFYQHKDPAAFNNLEKIFDWVKSIGKTEAEFGINARDILINHGFVLSDAGYNLNVIDSAMRLARDNIDFVKLARNLDEARKIIDMGLKSGELIDVFVRYGRKLGVDTGEGLREFIKYALDIDSDDIHKFSYSIYDAGSPYKYMNQIFDFINKLSYANDIVNRF